MRQGVAKQLLNIAASEAVKKRQAGNNDSGSGHFFLAPSID